MFWTIAVVLTLVTIAIVIYPLMRKERELDSADAYDLKIYKSQLQEIEGDVERGLIDETEAESARAEVARRLIGAQDALEKKSMTLTSKIRLPQPVPRKQKVASQIFALLWLPLLFSFLCFL